MNADRVLVVRVGRAGDMVMVTPALQAVLGKHQRADVHLLTSRDGQRVLRGFDARINKVLIYERKGLGALWARRRLRREIALGGYGDIYCFETKASFRRLFDGAARLHALDDEPREPVHFAERCLRVVRDQAAAAARPSLRLAVSAQGRQAARALYGSAGIDDGDFVIGLHPSFSGLQKLALRARDAHRRKAWPIAAFARLAQLFDEHAARQKLRVRIVCDLLPQERRLGEALLAQSGGRVTLFTEAPDFERYKATIARMNLLVTPDTGPMHIAAALGVPLTALFCGNDPRDCGPYTDPARYVVLRAEDMPQPERGLAAIPPEAVFAAGRKFLPP